MAWTQTTHWTDTKMKNIEEAVSHASVDRFASTYSNKSINKLMKKNGELEVSNKKIIYNILKFYADFTNPAGDISTIRYNIIVYQESGSTMVNYIINKNSGALSFLRNLFNYERNKDRGAIIQKDLGFDTDILLWLVKKVYLEESSFGENGELEINDIFELKGETADENKLSAKGETLFKLVSALTFILDSNLLRQLAIRIQFEEHENLELNLKDTKVMSIELENYSGIYENYDSDQKKASILLLCYLNILPKLRSYYYLEQDEEEWNAKIRNSFFDLIQDQLIQRITEKRSNT